MNRKNENDKERCNESYYFLSIFFILYVQEEREINVQIMQIENTAELKSTQ
jgi:hypothetical protein